jgi:hypothetical protein
VQICICQSVMCQSVNCAGARHVPPLTLVTGALRKHPGPHRSCRLLWLLGSVDGGTPTPAVVP